MRYLRRIEDTVEQYNNILNRTVGDRIRNEAFREQLKMEPIQD